MKMKLINNLDILAVGIVALVVVTLDVFEISSEKWVRSATLAVLTLIAISLTRVRKRVQELTSSIRASSSGHKFESAREVDNRAISQRVGNAKTIDWLAFTNETTLKIYSGDIGRCLRNGGKIRVLVVNPEGVVPKLHFDAGYIRSPDKREMVDDVKKSLFYCKDFNKEAASDGENGIQVRFLAGMPPYRFTMYNRAAEDGYLRIHLIRAPEASEEATIAWKKIDDPAWFGHFAAEFERFWAASKPANLEDVKLEFRESAATEKG